MGLESGTKKGFNFYYNWDEEYEDLTELKKLIAGIKDDIRKLGDVNVNAIEDYL